MDEFSWLAHLSWHCRQDTQWFAQQVLQVSPSVDHMRDIEFSYWTDPIWTFVID